MFDAGMIDRFCAASARRDVSGDSLDLQGNGTRFAGSMELPLPPTRHGSGPFGKWCTQRGTPASDRLATFGTPRKPIDKLRSAS
jgi:hypothetical protein